MLFIWYFGERYCKLCNDFDDMKNNISLILYVIQLSDRVYNVKIFNKVLNMNWDYVRVKKKNKRKIKINKN
jgi:hypothetical protein